MQTNCIDLLKAEIAATEQRIIERKSEWDLIVVYTAEEFGTTTTAINAPGRAMPAADARQAAIFLISENYPASSDPLIAEFFGRDRTTIVAARRIIKAKCEADSKFRCKVQQVNEKILAMRVKIGQAEVVQELSKRHAKRKS